MIMIVEIIPTIVHHLMMLWRLCFSSIAVDVAPAVTLNAKGTAAIQTGQKGSLMSSSSLSFIFYTLISFINTNINFKFYISM